ncbi:fimbria/pilus outer membrane usher protein [Enterobacter ludwigii]|uniref:fimbria/pilus outer membrane usher protein n=1 Tax=Enterobacter ludwigii TaxID=299767 RepID=UPI003975FB2E
MSQPHFKKKLLAVLAISHLLTVTRAASADVIPSHSDNSSVGNVLFDPVFLNMGLGEQISVRRFEKGSATIPGRYRTDIYINGIQTGTEEVIFSEESSGVMNVKLSANTIRKFNPNEKNLDKNVVQSLNREKEGFFNITDVFPDAGVEYDPATQRLDLTVAQAYLHSARNGRVSPELWDEGINAMMLGYQSNYYSMSSHGKRYDSAYIGINGGVNVGLWQLRHNGNYSWDEYVGSQYQRTNTYIQRDISSVAGRLIIGENHTSGNLFSSLPFRGFRMMDDDRMLPQDGRGYAPEIRGVARTNAKVTIRQNGQILRETTVAPGAFSIDDLYATGYGGDLDVTVTEADGTQQIFSVPYASVGQLLRPGMHHYDLVLGEFNDSRLSDKPALYQATYQRGLNNTVTGYGGLQFSQNTYHSILAGTALNTFFGAVSFDVTRSHAQFKRSETAVDLSGQSYGLTYSKIVPDTKSNLTLAAYRYSTSGYLDYRTAMLMKNELDNGRSTGNIFRPKSRASLTLNQGLPETLGHLYFTGYTQSYWNKDGKDDLQYQLGYNNSYSKVSFSLNAGRSRNGQGLMETTFTLNLNLPIGGNNISNTTTMNASFTRNSSGYYGQQAGISGTAGKEHQFSYGASAAHYNNGSGTSSSLNGQYRAQLTNLSASASKGKAFSSLSAGAAGTVLAWPGGITLTPYTSDTFAIVEAEGAKGARVGNYSGVKVDHFGHAAVPYLNPYELNEISLDPKGLPNNIELENTSQKVAPYAGSVVKLKYNTRKGYPLIFDVSAQTSDIPFGSDVSDSYGNNVGLMGQGNQIYARLNKTSDILKVTWGSKDTESCYIKYSFKEAELHSNKLKLHQAVCSKI